MHKQLKKISFGILIFLMFGFSAHKYYVSIYQIDYNESKKRLEITSRIFLDDINKTLLIATGAVTTFEVKTKQENDLIVLKKYMANHFLIKINKKPQQIELKNFEIENNMLICYWVIKDLKMINSIEIQNNTLFEISPEQQNIMHFKIKNLKSSLIFTKNDYTRIMKVN